MLLLLLPLLLQLDMLLGHEIDDQNMKQRREEKTKEIDRTDSAPQNSFSYYFESCTLLVLTARCCFKLKSNNLFKGKRK